MEKEKSYKLVVVLLTLAIVIILATSCILFTTGTIGFKGEDECIKEVSTVSSNTTISSNTNVVGIYHASFTLPEENAGINLYLYENGIFKYEFSQYAPFGSIGNYLIKDNKIILNYLFNTNSGTDFEMTKGSKTLTINSDGNIIDEDIKVKTLTNENIKTVTLVKKLEDKYNMLDIEWITENILNGLVDTEFTPDKFVEPNV